MSPPTGTASEETARTPIGVGVIGLGFMGRTHIQAFAKADGSVEAQLPRGSQPAGSRAVKPPISQ